MNVFKSIALTKDFFSLEEADTWIDEIIKEFDEFNDVYTSINGNGLGVYTANISFTQEYQTDGTSLVRQDSGEPDLFDAG